MRRPNQIALKKWPRGWLVLEVASLLDDAAYIIMNNYERAASKLPVTENEMREFIRERRKVNADSPSS
jgi:hypothetical protein